MNEGRWPCVFMGGTLNGVRQGRVLHGYAPASIMEPTYEPTKDGNLVYANITSRQVYVRDRRLDKDGMLGYRLDATETP